MAQILKFAAGGKTYSNTLTINGEIFNVTDDLIKSFYKHGENAANEGVKYQYYKIADALKAGKTLELSGKSLIGDVDFDTSNYGESRMKKGVKWALGREQDAREAIDHALKFTYNIPPAPEPEKTKYDWSKKLTASYDVKTEGKGKNAKTTKTWINSLDNNEFLKRLDAWKSIATGTDNNIELLGLDGITVRQLRDHYHTLGQEKFDELYTRIKEGTATKADHEILKAYNLFLFEDEAPKDTSTGKVSSSSYVGGNYPSPTLYNGKTSNLFSIDPNTNQIVFNDPDLLAFLQTHPNIWINESFVSVNPQYADILKYFPKGVMIFQDGSIYDARDIDTLNQHPIFQQFVLRNKETAGSSNEIIMQWWDNENDEIFKKMGENEDSLTRQLNGRYIRDLSGRYDKLPSAKTTEGNEYTPTHLIEIYPEKVSDEMFDSYGHILPKYIQKVAYTITDNNQWKQLNIPNDSTYLKSLPSSSTFSNIYRQEMKENNPFIVKSEEIDGHKYDIISEAHNYKVLRDELNEIRILITNNGKWEWYKIIDQNIYNNIITNPKIFDVDYFIQLFNNNKVKKEERDKFFTDKFIPKGSGGMKLPWYENSELRNLASKIDLNGDVPKSSYIPGYHDNVDLYDVTDPYRFFKAAENAALEKKHNDAVKLFDSDKFEAKLNAGKPEIITTNFHRDHPTYFADQFYGSKDKRNFNFRPDDAWALADLATSFIGNKKSIDKQKEAIWNAVTYKKVPVLQRPIFSDNGLMHQKQAAINRITNTPIRYSDAALNSSEYLNKLSLVENIHANTNAQLSDLYSKYKLQLLDIANKESALNTETDYENRKMYNTARAAMDQYDASRIAANGESVKKFIYEQREKTKQDLANLQQIALASKQGEFDAAMKAEFEKRGGWSQIKDEELRNMLMENANYQMAMRHIDPAYVSNEYNRFFKDVKLDPTYRQGIIPYWMYGKSYTNYNKKGGKINNVFHDAFLEDIKATNKALESLHKDIRKLLFKLTK